MPSNVDQRLAASHHLRQIEALVRLERIVEDIDLLFDSATSTVFAERGRAIAESRPPRVTDIYARTFAAATQAIDLAYNGLAAWAYATSVASLAMAVPRDFFSNLSPMLAMFETTGFTEMEDDEGILPALRQIFGGDETDEDEGALPFLRQLIGDLQVDNFTEPIALGSVSDLTPEQWQGVLQVLVFPPPTPARSRQLIEAPDEQGFGFADRLLRLTSKAEDADRVASEISTGFSDGEDLQELEKRIRPLVDGIKSSAKRVVRTEGLRIAERMQRETWDALGDTMIAVQILAVLDQNTRPAHALRNGRLHYREPVGDQLGLDTLPLLPDEPNCRCWSTPVLRPPPGLENNPALQAAFQNIEGAGIPDPATYDRWFSSVGEGRRKLAVGSRRYDVVRNALGGSREPEWSDFIDPDTGAIIATATLKNENALDRADRKLAVNALISERRALISQIRSVGFLSP